VSTSKDIILKFSLEYSIFNVHPLNSSFVFIIEKAQYKC